MKTKNGIIHQIAYCQTCGKSKENHVASEARKWAYAHAKSTGHKVTVETGSFITYNP
jgi:hypothetical protein